MKRELQGEFNKDRKILVNWTKIALIRASKKGFTRIVKFGAYIDEWMGDPHAFYTQKEDKNIVISWMVEDFLLLEKVCRMIDSGELSSVGSLKRMVKYAQW